MSTTRVSKPADLLDLIEKPLGTSRGHEVSQDRVNLFVDATGDHQWIHVDPVRAAAGPFGGMIVRCYLARALAPLPGSLALQCAPERPAGLEAVCALICELEGSDRPACVAEAVALCR